MHFLEKINNNKRSLFYKKMLSAELICIPQEVDLIDAKQHAKQKNDDLHCRMLDITPLLLSLSKFYKYGVL